MCTNIHATLRNYSTNAAETVFKRADLRGTVILNHVSSFH